MIPGFGRTGFGRDEIYPDIDIYIYRDLYMFVYPIDQVTYPIFQWIPLIYTENWIETSNSLQ